ncbi:DUF488 family protein [Rhodobacter sp. SGA-6-6]|uniref:DUF488 domain-containing protein n=1 Tax=Rhodobacter sp. SGA-6-6 TaxID=2710882 RepID=UPI0013EA1114|nr:DUF488 family protein [Rhodobacter sp. SGA-6-6]NGM46231.1 DUF488 family protein [Rhodobacter sp. SGA-6-6]
MTLRFPIHLARVYDADLPAGARLLVDRLWPRGIAKAELHLDGWPKQVTPDSELRKWFHAEPEARWPDFRKRYRDQLESMPEAVAHCLDWCRKGPVVLLTAARDPERSHAAVLRDVLTDAMETSR